MANHVLLLFTTWLLSVYAYDVHKHMTIEEIRSTFHVDSHDLVPEYDVVHIQQVARSKRSVEASRDNTLQNTVDSKSNSKYKKTKNDFWSTETVKLKDDRTKLRLTAFGKPVHLNLVPNPGLLKKGGLKVWTVEPNATSQHGVEYVEIPETNENIGEIYQDEENQAAVLLRNDDINGALIVEGSIGADLVIRPFPSRLKPFVKKLNATEAAQSSTDKREKNKKENTVHEDDDEMFLDADGELSAEVAIDTGLPINRKSSRDPQGHQHIVYRRRQYEQEDAFSDYAFMEPDHLSKRFKRSTEKKARKSRMKREAPYTIYPEILVIVDYDGYRLHDGNNVQVKRYFVSFWNGVDLRYKLLKGPKIRISIAGIIISRGRDATPYLERNRVGRDAIDSAAALTDMGKYLFRERRLPVYDIAVAITKYDMCRRRKGGRCTKGTAGFAYVGGACVVNKRLEKVNSVAIIEDTGGFSGIIVAAHEVGHLLGAVHDGSPPPSYLGGPGAEKCQWTDGYIMSDLRHTERGFRWSTCSVASFHHFLNGDTATCLYNAPHEDDSLPRVLPGKLLTLDAQCRRDRGTSACFKDDRVCAQLFCFDAGSGYCVAYRPAAEGSPCGDGQYCLNGRCVAEHENIIPDYSQNTPSYVRRDGTQASPGRPLFENGESNYDVNNDQGQPPTYQQYTTNSPYLYQYQYQSSPPQSTQNPYNQQDSYYSAQNPYSTQSSTVQDYSYFSVPTTPSSYSIQYFSNQPVPQVSNQPIPQQPSQAPVVNYQTTAERVSSVQTPSTTNPYIGNYYILIQQTTKNPYNFANFGKSFATSESPYSVDFNDNINNNYLKRSYNSASFFMDSSNLRNTTTNVSRQG